MNAKIEFLSSTGNHQNVNLLATYLEFLICTGFNITVGNSDIPYICQADTSGMFHFALLCLLKCTVLDGIMEVMTTLADLFQYGYQNK